MDGIYTFINVSLDKQTRKMVRTPVFKFIIENNNLAHLDPKHAEGLREYPEGPVDEHTELLIKKGLYGGSYWYLKREDLDQLAQFGEVIQRLGIKVGHLAYNPHLDKMIAIKSIDQNGIVHFYQPVGTTTDTDKYSIPIHELDRLTQQKILRPWE